MGEKRNMLVTGGAGFIGSALCRHLIAGGRARVLNVDCLTYAGDPRSLQPVASNPDYAFAQVNIGDADAVAQLLRRHEIDIVIHLAAESHVDRSIDTPGGFIETNVVGTYRLLASTLDYWRTLKGEKRKTFRFHHVSTDEVFGDLPFDSGVFSEESPYRPSSPYSASKAAADHLVRAWRHTYGLPVVLSNCSNNYGPYQFPEKLIPLVILNALHDRPLPIYGRGDNVRDWLFVGDHARALELIATRGRPGESYNVGGREERSNLQVVEAICDALDGLRPRAGGGSYRELIAFVTDRPGHDRRYAVDPSKIERDLGWRPEESFASGLMETVRWYLDNDWWWRPLRETSYAGERLGLRT